MASVTGGGAKPAVSAVIGCYNQPRYLAPAIDSVVAETLHNWEAIIVDDGVADETGELSGQATEVHTPSNLDGALGGPGAASAIGLWWVVLASVVRWLGAGSFWGFHA